MNDQRKAKREPGQLVRLTVRDYQYLLEACRMADEWRGSRMENEHPEFDEMSRDRWNSLMKIRNAVYPKRKAKEAA
jgi:hypothetical protein